MTLIDMLRPQHRQLLRRLRKRLANREHMVHAEHHRCSHFMSPGGFESGERPDGERLRERLQTDAPCAPDCDFSRHRAGLNRNRRRAREIGATRRTAFNEGGHGLTN